MHNRRPDPRARARGLAFLGLALALLLAQGLGLRHQLAHGPHAAPPAQARADASAGHAHHAGDAGHADYAGHDEGSVQCRLYDQLAHADGLTGSMTPAALPAPVDRVQPGASMPVPRPAPRHFEARGPPPAA